MAYQTLPYFPSMPCVECRELSFRRVFCDECFRRYFAEMRAPNVQG